MSAYTLAARASDIAHTIIEIPSSTGTVALGEGSCTIIAGPCAVESRENYIGIAMILKNMGVHILRGGAYKPRTSPYSFSGLGREGLLILDEARRLTGLPVATEAVDARDLDSICSYSDIVQIGSRNMQNFTLLREAGRIKKPVILKRGLAATMEEWLLAAEYILSSGNDRVILCERGIRSFDTATRNLVDIAAVPLVKELSHLPVIVDPSHATGRRSLIKPIARAAIAAGADGIMIEVHQQPDLALSDGQQSLNPEQFAVLVKDVAKIAMIQDKKLK